MSGKLSESDARAMGLIPKRGRKFHNTPVVGPDITGKGYRTYDSKKEAERAGELRLLQMSGAISGLQHHVKFKIVINGIHICDYEADFVYNGLTGLRIVEDVKCEVTAENATYRLKKKLMKAVLGIEIEEIGV